MSQLVIETPEGIPLRYEIAGAGTRILAAGLDGLIWAGGLLSLMFLLLALGLGPSALLVGSGVIVSLVLYSFVSCVIWNGRTPGKALLGIRVCDEQGGSAGTVQHLLRALFLPLEALVMAPIPLLWILLASTARHQRLGDLVAGTLVLSDPDRATVREPVPHLRWSKLDSPRLRLDPGTAGRLGAGDLAFLRELLTRQELEPRSREHLERLTARRFSERLGLPESGRSVRTTRAFLRELFLYLREMRELTSSPRPVPLHPDQEARDEPAGARDSSPGRGSPPR